jgi:hypothetical protein
MSFWEPQVTQKLNGSRQQGLGKYLKNVTEEGMSSHNQKH